jgi:fatty acid desaturase
MTIRPLVCAAAALAVVPELCSAFSPALLQAGLRQTSHGALSRQQSLPTMARRSVGRMEVRAVASLSAETIEALGGVDTSKIATSGLNGLALSGIEYPTRKEVFQAIPEHCFKRNTAKSMFYAVISTAMTLACGWAGWQIPLTMAMAPVWFLYAMVTGCVATGMWVVAHECGHGAFSDNKAIQDFVGYAMHSFLMVPYFSWQRSHAVHHSKTNHLTEGETHVPYTIDTGKHTLQKLNGFRKFFGKKLGTTLYGLQRVVSHLVFGWPAYLLAGVTGGPVRGLTNHFIPVKPFSTGNKNTELFPGRWKRKVWLSDVGILGMVGAVAAVASKIGWVHMSLMYLAPLAFTNCWLVLYTWLQHTDVDVPHYEADNWNFIKGAFLSIDRPYGPVFDFLHHRIGSTHVVHHIDCTIPHYNALEATKAIQKAFPKHYLYDPTPLPQALWRVSSKCVAVDKMGGQWVFRQDL